MTFKWKNILKGFAMGTSDLVPGISGGTIALLLFHPLVDYFLNDFGQV